MQSSSFNTIFVLTYETEVIHKRICTFLGVKASMSHGGKSFLGSIESNFTVLYLDTTVLKC